MSRDEEARLNARGEDAAKRLCRGIESSKIIVARYRAKLLALRAALERGSTKAAPAPARPRR